MLKYLSLLTTLFHLLTPECLEGCLKCNTRDECLFCDGTSNYILDGLTCKKIQLSNCLTINIAGNCLTCDENYYLDKQTYKCVNIEESNQIENCLAYEGAKECSVCMKDFIIDNSVCKAVEKAIEGCEMVDAADSSKCSACGIEYILALDKKSCVKISDIQNCGSYSLLQCVSCKDNYVINKNIYIDKIYNFNDEIAKFVVLRKLLWDKVNYPDQGTYDICKKIEVQNCLEYISFSKCKTCKPNFYQTEENTCVAFPNEQIIGCLKYINATTCSECETGKFLKSPEICEEVAPVPNCTSYSSTSNKTLCLTCEITHYLDEKSNCIQRTELSDFLSCFTKNPNSDSCMGCDTGLQLTTDKLACLSEVSNCIEYTDSDKNTSDLVCKKCKEGMYYNNSLVRCETGTISNCEAFKDTSNECVKCINQYYLKSNQCLKHSDLFSCMDYNAEISKTCDSCGGSSYKFVRFNGCALADTEIDNCDKFATTTTCGTCNLDYFTNNVGSCEKITAVPNCRKVKLLDPTKCEICKEDYFIKDGLCELPQDYFKAQCEKNNIDGLIDYSQVECEYCFQNSIPYNYKNNYSCVSPSTIPLEKQTSNCLKYIHNDDDTYTCTYCDNDFNIPSSAGSCSLNCPSSEGIDNMQGLKYSSTGVGASTYNRYSLTNFKKCIDVSATDEGCVYLYPHIFSSSNANNDGLESSCILCKEGFFRSIKDNAVVMVDDAEGAFYLGRSVLSAHPGVSCKTENDTNDPSLVVANCEYYVFVSDTDIKCIRCKTGFHGDVVVDKIDLCVEMNSCDVTTQVVDGGLLTKPEYLLFGTALSTFFSCFKCKAVNHIPMISISFPAARNGKPPVLKAYKIKTVMDAATEIYSTLTEGVTGKNIDCYDITNRESFGIELANNFTFPTNCALGYINVDSKANASTSIIDSPTENQAAVQCIACKSGFRPIRHVSVSQTISRNGINECEDIGDSCSSSVWLNSCSECRSGHIYNYDDTKKIVEFDKCIVFADSNCFAALLVDGVYKCKYCKKGYSKNLDESCELINSPKCIVGEMNFMNEYENNFTYDQFNVGFYLTPRGSGCHKCFGGYVGLKSSSLEQEFICTESDYVKSGIYVSNTNLINNCMNYIVNSNDDLICKVCDENFLPSTNGKCVPQSNSANCVFFKGEVICQECKEGYVVISGICEEKNIENCIIFEEGELVEAQNCIKCEPDYYPSDLQCKKGIIDFCEILSGTKTCEKCLDNYTKVVTTDATDYCFPISPELNCSLLDEGKFSNLEVNCKECNKGFALSSNSLHFNNTICMNFRHYDNCEEYEIHENIEQSSFKCKKCLISHYLDENKECLERKNKPSNCIDYVINADMCMKCEDGFYVGENGLLCVNYPLGIQGCIDYENDKVCLGCKKNMYLVNNKCLEVPETGRIEKCVFYESEKRCGECDVGYAVEDVGCVVAQALNCLKFKSKIACDSCPDGYGFKEESGIKNCVEKNITKCIVSENFFPFICLTCAKDFFPEKGKCIEVLQTIKDCQIYQDGSKCLSCIEGTTLSADQKECLEDLTILALLDNQCKESKIGDPQCMTCKKGYVMDEEGKCVACTNSKFENGCYNCNPTDQTLCIICAPGYYQTKDSECKKSSDVKTDETDGGKDGEGEGETEEFVRVLGSCLGVLIFLFY